MQASSTKDRIKQVADRVTFASMNYRIWRIYTEPGGRAKYLGVLQRYNSFLRTSLQAHFVATIITLYGLYETRRESISLTRLVQEYPMRSCVRKFSRCLTRPMAFGARR